MRIKKLSVRMLIAVILGLCAGIIMELNTSGFVFPTFLIIGIFAGVFIGIVIEIVRGTLKIAGEDFKKLKKIALRILIAASIGLLAGIVLEFTTVWHSFPFFLILAVVLGVTIGITIEVIRYHRLMKKAFLESNELGLKKLPVGTAEFIRQIIRKMRYRKDVRSEVMAELASHFQDELRDCRTDEDKQKKARQLIDDFGDTKLLAILLRRAKVRCRPLWRTVVIRTFQTIGVLIPCLIIYAVWFSTGKPTISVDYLAKLNQMNRPEVRDKDNAWPHYEKAIKLFVEPHQRILELLVGYQEKEFRKRFYFSDLGKEKQDKIRQWLKENESLWEKLNTTEKQLIGRCLKESLVPLAGSSYSAKYASKQYGVLDGFVKATLVEIEKQQAREADYFSGYDDIRKMHGYRHIELDPDIALDSEVIDLFGGYSLKELREIKGAIDVGVIKYWIDSPPIAVKSLYGCLLPFERKLILKWIEDNEEAWREFKIGSLKSYCYREHQCQDEDKFLWRIFSTNLYQMERLATVGIWRSQVAAYQGHFQKSIEDCCAIARTGSHLQNRGAIIEHIYGLIIRRIAYDEIFHILTAQRLSAIELKKLQDQLTQLYPQGYPLLDMEGEKMAFMDAIQRLFTEGGPGGGHLIPRKTETFGDLYDNITEIAEDVPVGKKFIENVTLTSMCLLHARRDATVELGEQIYDRQTEIVRMSPYQRHKSDIYSNKKTIMAKPRYRYAVLYNLMPASGRVSERIYQGKVLHEAIIAILAIKRWRLEKNEYPTSLDELVEGGFLKELPMDPYSDISLLYKNTGNNFVLYSVGLNFRDDGGNVFEVQGREYKWGTKKEGDAVFWPVPKLLVKK